MPQDRLDRSSTSRTIRHARSAALLACLLMLALVPSASAATATNAWLAKVGTSGANGMASINAYTTGTGSLVLKLKKLAATRTLPVTLLKESCKGATLLTLTAVKSTSTGSVTRTSSLTAAQVNAIRKATTGTAKFALRIGTGTTAKCGVFAGQFVPAYVAAKVTVGVSPSGIAVDASGIWVANWWDNTMMKINPATNGLTLYPVDVPGDLRLEEVAAGVGSIWVSTTGWDEIGSLPGYVMRIDPTTGQVLAAVPVGRDSTDIAVGLGAVWVTNLDDGTVMRIDPATNKVVATISVPQPFGVAVDATAVWVSHEAGMVSRIDPATNTVVATIGTQQSSGYIAAGAGGVWVSNNGISEDDNGTVVRIDPATNKVVAIVPVGGYPQKLAIAGGSVWVGLEDAHAVARIDARTNVIISKTALSHSVYTIDATDHAVWAVHNLPFPEGGGTPPPGEVIRIGY